MKVSNTLFASVLAIGAVLGAPVLALDLGEIAPATETAPVEAPKAPALAEAPVAAPAEAPAKVPAKAPVLGTSEEAAKEAPVAEIPAKSPAEKVAEKAAETVAGVAGGKGETAAPPALPVEEKVAEVTPPPLPELPAYYVGIDGEPVGPLHEEDLRDLIRKGALTDASLVWTEGMGDWVEAAEVADIKDLLDAAPVKIGAKAEEAAPKPVVAEPKPAPKTPTVISASAIMPGVWQIDGMMPVEGLGMGDADVTMVFNPDGTYQTRGTIIAVVPGLTTVPVEIVIETVGIWQIVENADGTAEMDIEATTYYAIPSMGVPPQMNAASDSFDVQVIDGNTIIADGAEWVRVAA